MGAVVIDLLEFLIDTPWKLIFFVSANGLLLQASQAQNTSCMGQLVYIENRMGQLPIVNIWVNNCII